MTDDHHQRFEEAFRSWAHRPAATPPEQAVRQVRARLPEQDGRSLLAGPRLRLVAAGAGLAVVLAAGWLAVDSGPPAPADEVALPTLDENVILLWLDDETPLYLTIAPPATKGES